MSPLSFPCSMGFFMKILYTFLFSPAWATYPSHYHHLETCSGPSKYSYFVYCSNDDTSIKARGTSISEALTNSPKTNKASIISRMARMGQATLPLKGAIVYNPSDSEETEASSHSSLKVSHFSMSPPVSAFSTHKYSALLKLLLRLSLYFSLSFPIISSLYISLSSLPCTSNV